jgi:hypothetical protein
MVSTGGSRNDHASPEGPRRVLPAGTLVDTVHPMKISTPSELYRAIDDSAIGRQRFAAVGNRCSWAGEAVDHPYGICALSETILKPDEMGQIRILWARLASTFHTRLELTLPISVIDLTMLTDAERAARAYLAETNGEVLRESSRAADAAFAGDVVGILWESLRAGPCFALTTREGVVNPDDVWSIIETGPIAENERLMKTIRDVSAAGGDALR